MSEVQLNNPNYATSFFMAVGGDRFKPAIGLSPLPRPRVAKNGAPFVPALGQVTEQGSGWYALLGHPQDRDVLGALLVGGDVDDPDIQCIEGAHEVKNYDPQVRPTQEESDLAQIVAILETLNNNFRVFASEHVTSLLKGNIQ